MLNALDSFAVRWSRTSPFTDVYGLARTLLALSMLGTFLATSADSVFRPLLGAPDYPHCSGVSAASLFCLVPADQLPWARLIAIAVLVVVASGWRPRVTALPHWWVAWSFQASAALPDGGDQVHAVLALLILPVALLDRRRWHWQRPAPVARTAPVAALAAVLAAWSALFVARLQVASIYLQASVAKLAEQEWVDGTSIYYWFHDPLFGLPAWAAPWLGRVVETAPGAVALTWGPIMIEFALFLGLVARRPVRPALLLLGAAFHLGIGVFMGLGSFMLAMWGALILFLRPSDLHFGIAERTAALAARVRPRPTAASAAFGTADEKGGPTATELEPR